MGPDRGGWYVESPCPPGVPYGVGGGGWCAKTAFVLTLLWCGCCGAVAVPVVLYPDATTLYGVAACACGTFGPVVLYGAPNAAAFGPVVVVVVLYGVPACACGLWYGVAACGLCAACGTFGPVVLYGAPNAAAFGPVVVVLYGADACACGLWYGVAACGTFDPVVVVVLYGAAAKADALLGGCWYPAATCGCCGAVVGCCCGGDFSAS